MSSLLWGSDRHSSVHLSVAGHLDAFTYAMMAEVGGQEFFNKALQYDEEVWSSAEMDQMFGITG